jgi:hypothetical protein
MILVSLRLMFSAMVLRITRVAESIFSGEVI